MNTPIVSIWESILAEDFKILESSSEVDGVNFLARVEGPAFFPDTISGNNVHYPIEAWESAINDPDFKSRLRDRLVFGTIGHQIELTDNEIREGKFSHLITRVWIDEANIGMAEYLIYNSDPGIILNRLLRTRSKLRVSTKAEGHFQSLKDQPGIKSVIPNSFKLDRIDFVIDPGYKEALPELVESQLRDNDKGIIMSIQDQTKVETILEAQINELKGERSITSATITKLQESLQKVTEANAAVQTELSHFKELGTYAFLHESLAELSQYRSIGKYHQIIEALEDGEEAINDLTDTVKDLQTEKSERPDEYEELGEPSEIKQALEKALGMSDELKTYRAMGSADEIQDALSGASDMADQLKNQTINVMSDTHGVDSDTIRTLVDSGVPLDQVNSLISKIKNAAGNTEVTGTPVVPSVEPSANESASDPEAGQLGPQDDDEQDILQLEDTDGTAPNESRNSSKGLRTRVAKKPAITESKGSVGTSRAARLMSARR